MFKRIISGVTAMVLAIPMLGVVAFAEENNTSLDNINESDSTTIVNDELTVDEMIEEMR